MTILCLGAEGFDCSLAWMAMIGLFFLGAILRKQVSELMDMEFSLIGGVSASTITFIILFLIFHSLQWSSLAGLLALILGGFLLGPLIGGGGGGFD